MFKAQWCPEQLEIQVSIDVAVLLWKILQHCDSQHPQVDELLGMLEDRLSTVQNADIASYYDSDKDEVSYEGIWYQIRGGLNFHPVDM